MAPGWFITLEGVEAVGKTTQLRLLAARLESIGKRVLQLREPGGTPLGEKLRDLLKHAPEGKGREPSTELLLLSASRAELVAKVIRPALAAGTVVLSDRFCDSTLAYQGGGRGMDRELLDRLIELAVGQTRPDLTLWLRLPDREIARRVSIRDSVEPNDRDHFESESAAFFSRVESAFQSLAVAEPERIHAVDGQAAIPDVADAIWSVVKKRFSL